jgi:hypothetical protein
MKLLRKLTIITMLFSMLAMSGCTLVFSSANFSHTRDTMYKHDSYVNTGQSAAYYNDKVYFVSQEKSVSGLYSMNNDGSGLELEFTLPKITRITINDEGYYYVGITTNRSKDLKVINEEHYFYSLFRIDKLDFRLEEIQYTDDPKHDESVSDGFILDNGIIIIRVANNLYGPYFGIQYTDTSFITEEPNEIVGFTRFEDYNEDDGAVNYKDTSVPFDIVKRNGYLESYCYSFKSETPKPIYVQGKLLLEEGAQTDVFNSFIDIGTNKFQHDEMYLSGWGYFKLIYTTTNEVFVAKNNQLNILDLETLELKHDIGFEGVDEEWKLTRLFCADQTYALFMNDDEYIMKLYKIDRNEMTSSFVMDINTIEKRLIHIEDDWMLYAEDNKIICKKMIDDGLGEKKYEINLKKYLNDNHILELAGDWLFIHKKGKKDNPNKLVYRVNLLTKEVIKIK